MKNHGIWAIAALICFNACKPGTDVDAPTFAERTAFSAERLYPEGIAYAPSLNQFVVTSITQGKVGLVDMNGRYAELFSDPQLISAIGAKVQNGKLYVCNGDQGVSSKSTTQSKLNTAGLFVYDISSGQIDRWVDLVPLLPDAQHFANDVAVSTAGVAYVTDSFAPVVYRVAPDGKASVLVYDSRFVPATGQFGLNGIVLHPGNYLIVAKAGTGQLFKIDLGNNNTVTEITGFDPLKGADGMVLLNDDLYVVNGQNKVTQLRGANNWATATIVKTDAVGYEQATTNTVVNGEVYTLNARIGEVAAAAQANAPASLTASAYSIQRFK
jgi:sugar lactone lactonase YvrE